MKAKKIDKEEEMDMISEENEVIGTMTRFEALKSNLLHRCVIVMVFNEGGEIFLQKRAKSKQLFPGKYDFSCSGGVMKGETYEDAAERELKEELGIDAPLNFVESVRYKDSKTNYIGHIYALSYDGKIKIDKKEIESGKFVSEMELKTMVANGLLSPDAKEILITYLDDIKEAIKC
jgi:isopentenyldiphosphate isomerase